MHQTTTLTPIQRFKTFKDRLDNSTVTTNTLSQSSHEECIELLQNLITLDIHSAAAKNILSSLEKEFISRFEYHQPVDWHFKQWTQTSFLSDSFASLLGALERDYKLISNERIGYMRLYGVAS